MHTLPLIVGGLPEGSPASLEPRREPSRQCSASCDSYVWLLKTFRCLLESAAVPADTMHAKYNNVMVNVLVTHAFMQWVQYSHGDFCMHMVPISEIFTVILKILKIFEHG